MIGILRWWRQPKPLEDPAAQLASCPKCGEPFTFSMSTAEGEPISFSMHRCEKQEAGS